jgi:hypothetical protein
MAYILKNIISIEQNLIFKIGYDDAISSNIQIELDEGTMTAGDDNAAEHQDFG